MSDGLVKFFCIDGPMARQILWLGNEGKTAFLTVKGFRGRYVKQNNDRVKHCDGPATYYTLAVYWQDN